MRRVLTVAVLVAGFLVPATSTFLGPALAASPQPGSIGIRLLDAPRDAGDDPRARRYIVDYLRLGAVIHRHIEVSNKTGSTARIAVYPGAASISNGSFNVAAGQTPNELTTWIRLDRSDLTLEPGASASVGVTITVPPDASPGERYAAIWGQIATGSAGQDKGVLQVSRVGVRVYLAVGPGGPPPADFAIESLTAQNLPGGQRAILARVRNTGGRALDLSGEIRLVDGPGGLSGGPFPARLGTTLARNQAEPVTVLLDRRLPGGTWKALIKLRSGLTERSATASVTLPEGSGAAGSGGTSTGWHRYLPGILVAVSVLAATVALTLTRRRRRSDRGGPGPNSS